MLWGIQIQLHLICLLTPTNNHRRYTGFHHHVCGLGHDLSIPSSWRVCWKFDLIYGCPLFCHFSRFYVKFWNLSIFHSQNVTFPLWSVLELYYPDHKLVLYLFIIQGGCMGNSLIYDSFRFSSKDILLWLTGFVSHPKTTAKICAWQTFKPPTMLCFTSWFFSYLLCIQPHSVWPEFSS